MICDDLLVDDGGARYQIADNEALVRGSGDPEGRLIDNLTGYYCGCSSASIAACKISL